ncbi:two-component sensor histidine kinase [Rhodococcoides trifolii]|uniref:histidine kinase n=1 Tax=Rhodococcoides trifolii TaxID=908250 RepID=A0A917D5F0_9NOCA|nr:histidine kinase [Rhodococcus trifolii]GGG10340.1 two-component sensor histidine kinase [Rhodococcus trifolii]
MRALSLWLRQQPFVADCALAALLFALEVIGTVNADNTIAYLLVGIAVCAPVPWRRRLPLASAWAALTMAPIAALVSYAVGDDTTHLGLLSTVVALYTLVAYVGRGPGAIYLLVLVATDVFSTLLLDQPLFENLGVVFLVYSLAWISAEFNGARRAYDREVEARLSVAEDERDRRAVEAVAAERTRIARELHDVVAHAVSVMIVQADGASYTLRRDPDRAEAALGNISATGRQALSELRRTVALLRTESPDDVVPQYGTAALAKIVETMRSAGLAVQLEQSGDIDDIAPAVALGIHRLVQESLTNVLRHAGASPRARVTVRRRAHDVLVEIVDNGSGAGPVTSTGGGTGNGVLGMRERVTVLGGDLTVGRRRDGTWAVRAELPLELDS